MRRANVIAAVVAALWLVVFLINRQTWSAASDIFGHVKLSQGKVDLQLILPLAVVALVGAAAWISNAMGRWDGQLAFLSVALLLALLPYLIASVGAV